LSVISSICLGGLSTWVMQVCKTFYKHLSDGEVTQEEKVSMRNNGGGVCAYAGRMTLFAMSMDNCRVVADLTRDPQWFPPIPQTTRSSSEPLLLIR
jgi:hypothetical protein